MEDQFIAYENLRRQRELELSLSRTDPALARMVIDKLPDDKRQAVFQAANDPSAIGKIVTMGLASLAAPLILGRVLDPSGISTALQVLSVPLAALGGSTLYDYINAPTQKFHYTMPTNTDLLIGKNYLAYNQ